MLLFCILFFVPYQHIQNCDMLLKPTCIPLCEGMLIYLNQVPIGEHLLIPNFLLLQIMHQSYPCTYNIFPCGSKPVGQKPREGTIGSVDTFFKLQNAEKCPSREGHLP